MDVDLLIVGGGINGAGIARDAAGRGLSVLLVEKEPGSEVFEGINVSLKIHKLGYRGIETVELVYADHRVPTSALLGGEEGQGFHQMMGAVELGRINISARAVGVANGRNPIAIGELLSTRLPRERDRRLIVSVDSCATVDEPTVRQNRPPW